MKENIFSRRAFVQKYLYAGAVVFGGLVVFGCNPSADHEPPAHVPPVPEPVKPSTAKITANHDTVEKIKPVQKTQEPVAKTAKEKGKEAVAVDDCEDLSGVAPAELQKRKKLAYVSSSPIPDSNCGNCALHIPTKPGKNCGGCILFKGPVRDEGYCAYWAPINN
jgi:hypothetical protein